MKKLAVFLCCCASVGLSKSWKELLVLVQAIAESKRTQHLITGEWWDSFIKRYWDITLSAPVPLSQARARATDEEVMDKYFDLLEATLWEYDLLEKPGQIFNLDENGFPLNPKPPKGVFNKGTKIHLYMWLDLQKGSCTHNYKYLEIPFWNIQFIITQECSALVCISPLIYSYPRPFSEWTLQWIASWNACHFR